MIKLFIKLNDKDLSFDIAAKRGNTVLSKTKGHYDRDLADKLIYGLDKNLAYVKLKKREYFRAYYEQESHSFVSNLIGNSVTNIFNWLQKKT